MSSHKWSLVLEVTDWNAQKADSDSKAAAGIFSLVE